MKGAVMKFDISLDKHVLGLYLFFRGRSLFKCRGGGLKGRGSYEFPCRLWGRVGFNFGCPVRGWSFVNSKLFKVVAFSFCMLPYFSN